MDHRFFKVCNVIILIRANTHGEGGGHTDSESAQHFSLGTTLTIVFLVLLTGFEPQGWVA